MKEFHAIIAGARAAAALACVQVGAIAGATSRGTFVRYAGDHVIFVTGEPHRGPLTVNLPEPAARAGLPRLRAAMTANLGGGRLAVPEAGTVFDISSAEMWSAPAPSPAALPAAERVAAARALARQALAGEVASGFAAWLCELSADHPPPQELARLRDALRVHDVPAFVAVACDKLLGRGRGLTPSGDDTIAGLLLALNRWRDALWPGPGLEELNAGIIPVAYQRTTGIGASLIECAAQGEADERLIAAVDGIMTGVPAPAVCAAGLRSYGASSGVDALAGMVAALWAGEACGETCAQQPPGTAEPRLGDGGSSS